MSDDPDDLAKRRAALDALVRESQEQGLYDPEGLGTFLTRI
jgi:hypothetical protein